MVPAAGAWQPLPRVQLVSFRGIMKSVPGIYSCVRENAFPGFNTVSFRACAAHLRPSVPIHGVNGVIASA